MIGKRTVLMEKLLAESLIREIPDFPKPGIIFKDITPVLSSPEAFQELIDKFDEIAETIQPDTIAAIELRFHLWRTTGDGAVSRVRSNTQGR